MAHKNTMNYYNIHKNGKSLTKQLRLIGVQ